MKTFSEDALSPLRASLADLSQGYIAPGIAKLRALKDEIHAAIPEKQRIGRGITWVVKQNPQRAMDLLGVDEYHYKDRNFYRESR